MNSYDAPGQAATGRPGWDLIQAQDLLDEISTAQRFLTIADTLLSETFIELQPDLAVLFRAYLDAGIPEKLQAASDLLDKARKAIA